jgi:hypothetical protein
MVNEKIAQRARDAAENLTNAVNDMAFDYATFADTVARTHPTLQANVVQAMLCVMGRLNKLYQERRYDARNELELKTVAAMIKNLDADLRYAWRMD